MKRERYLKLNDAADAAGLSPDELRYRARKGLVPSGYVPGDVRRLRRFRRSDMEAIRRQIEETFKGDGNGTQ